LESISDRLNERDLVVKLNTGGGKTTIGLLYLKHLLDKYQQPAVYLVPNNQLAEQVIAEGANVGIDVCLWRRGETFAPDAALRCEALIVCTYEKFFNGRSTFLRQRIMPCAIVLDDVHAGIESVRKCFAAVIPDSARAQLLTLLEDGLSQNDPTLWAGISREASDAILEVPFWIQHQHQDEITSILARHAEVGDLTFSWSNIAQSLDQARIFLSGTSAYIQIDPASVERVPHFTAAKHRLFMSASVHDGAVLVRELSCSPDAAANPVDATGETSVGERMVIVPSLIHPDFSDSDLIEIARTVAGTANVVVLVPSFAHAKKWQEAGAIVADNNSVQQGIDVLRKSASGNIVVFAQRYDGVDLPDTACRLLIIDGLPTAESLADRHDSSASNAAAGLRSKRAIKVEQGLGRAVRSASDYSAVILAGRDLASFIARTDVVNGLSPYTVRQLEIGRDVSQALKGTENVVSGVIDTIGQMLRRDGGWKSYYSQQIGQVSVSDELKDRVMKRIACAALEREACKLSMARNYAGAQSALQRAADLVSEPDLRGLIKQSAARYGYFFDEASAMRMQSSAYADNPNVSRPPMLVPAQLRRLTRQAEAISHWLQSFTDYNAALIALDALKASLNFANRYGVVEEAVRELGALLGAESIRPDRDFRRGPDNLWIFSAEAYIIEVKNEKSANLSKGDAQQLQSSILWVEQNYRGLSDINAIILSDVARADEVDDFAFGAKIWSQADIYSIVDQLRKLASAAATQGSLFASSPMNIQGMLATHGLLPTQFRSLGGVVKSRYG
jgi:hypothetical protein